MSDNNPGATTARPRVLVTGATGYVGGRLLDPLIKRRYRVRCLARRPAVLEGRVDPMPEIVKGDIRDPETLRTAMEGVDTALFLVHALGASSAFEEQEYESARAFRDAAADAGVKHIVYLGGLAHGENLSPHLHSRIRVGEILAEGPVPVTEFRASVIIGSGSASFEMIRHLVNRLPVMVCPTWVTTPAQPIAIQDVIAYFLAAIESGAEAAGVYEIGGSETVSYKELMLECARQRGLTRRIIPVPILSPRLSSRWLALVTPLYAEIGRKLIDGVRNASIVEDTRALERFAIRPMDYRAAIKSALAKEEREFAETHWADALPAGADTEAYGGVEVKSRLIDQRERVVRATPEAAFAAVERIGGRTGWYYANWLWDIRGLIDLVVGGPGMRRGRRDHYRLRVGDVLDCWRVERIERPRRLRLSAEMKLPGQAWLEFEVRETPEGTVLKQAAVFHPKGLWGLMYWYGIYPLHEAVFAGMIRGVARAADEMAAQGE